MSSPLRIVAAVGAGGLAAFAIATGPNYAISLPAAVLAVGVATVALADAVTSAARAEPIARTRPAPHVSGARAWLRNGRLGREEIVLLLDRLERASLRPELPVRPAAELAEIVRLPPVEFRQYVNQRIDHLEGPV